MRRSRGTARSIRLLGLLAGLALLVSACTSGGADGPAPSSTAPVALSRPVVVGGADFTESRIMQALYGQRLEQAGLTVTYRPLAGREQYAPELSAGRIDVVPEYAATLAEYLNRQANGVTSKLVAGPDAATTVTAARPLAARAGLVLLAPARAANQNGFAVSAAFARKQRVGTLSELAAEGTPVVLAATEECGRRPFCRPGLERVYGLRISSVLPLGFGSPEAKAAVIRGEAGLALVGTTDGTLGPLGLKLLTDDRRLQLADNLVPAVNAAAARDRRLAAALDPLSAVLTTADLARLNEQVDGDRRTPESVATAYLAAHDLD